MSTSSISRPSGTGQFAEDNSDGSSLAVSSISRPDGTRQLSEDNSDAPSDLSERPSFFPLTALNETVRHLVENIFANDSNIVFTPNELEHAEIFVRETNRRITEAKQVCIKDAAKIEKSLISDKYNLLNDQFNLDREPGLKGVISSRRAAMIFNHVLSDRTREEQALSSDSQSKIKQAFDRKTIPFSQLRLIDKIRKFEAWLASRRPGRFVDKDMIRRLNKLFQNAIHIKIRKIRLNIDRLPALKPIHSTFLQ